MEKGILGIKLSYDPTMSDDKGKNNMDGSRLHDRIESLSIIKSSKLTKASDNQMGLLALNRPTRIIFNPINPLTT